MTRPDTIKEAMAAYEREKLRAVDGRMSSEARGLRDELMDALRRDDLTDRYWVFSFDMYYPSGGFEDIVSTATTLDAAVAFATMHRDHDEAFVFDAEARKVVWDKEDARGD